MARATQWKLEHLPVPDLLVQQALSTPPLRCAKFPAGCDCCQPAPLTRLRRGFSCGVTKAEWLALGDQDWRVVSVQDRGSEAKQACSDDVEVRKGSLVVFLCPEKSCVSGKAWAEADRKVLEQTANESAHPLSWMAAKSPKGPPTLSEGIRLELDGSSGAEFRVMRGATLLRKDKEYCTFEYEPLARISHNFGQVSDFAGSIGPVDFLWFRDEAVQPKRPLGARGGGLDVRGRVGVHVLGICRFTKAATWSDQLAVDVTWCPGPDFEVMPGDVAIALPSQSGALWAIGATIFRGISRFEAASSSPGRAICQLQGAGGLDDRRAGNDRPLPPGTTVEYYSATYGGWTPAVVQGFDEQTGGYVLDIQPVALASKVRLPGGAGRPEVQPTAPQLPLPTRGLHGGGAGGGVPTQLVGGMAMPPHMGRSPGAAAPGFVGTQDLHADLDHMANLVTRHQLSAADSPETMSAAAGARQEFERAKRRLREATLVRDAAKKAMSASWFYAPGKKDELVEAERAIVEAQREVDRWSILAELPPAALPPAPTKPQTPFDHPQQAPYATPYDHAQYPPQAGAQMPYDQGMPTRAQMPYQHSPQGIPTRAQMPYDHMQHTPQGMPTRAQMPYDQGMPTKAQMPYDHQQHPMPPGQAHYDYPHRGYPHQAQAGPSPTNPQLQYWDGTHGHSSALPSTKHMTAPAGAGPMYPAAGPPGGTVPVLGNAFNAASLEEQERMITKLMSMGFQRHMAEQAFKRCSTVEAAAQWLLERC